MATRTCEPAADNNFGPVVAICARLFDFTLLFEQSILSIPTDSLFIIVAGWRMWHLLFTARKVNPNRLLSAKLLGIFGVIGATLTVLILEITDARTLTHASIPSAAVALVASAMLPALSYFEHVKSIRPSTLLSCYLMLSCLLSLPELRTLYLLPGTHVSAAALTVVICLKLYLLVLEARTKRKYLAPAYRDLPREMTSGIFNRSLFIWLNAFFWSGFRRPVGSRDLGVTDSQLHSEALHDAVRREWKRQQLDCCAPLAKALFRALRRSCLAPVPARLCYAALLFAQPYLIQRTINFLREPPTRIGDDIGYGLIGATAVIYLGIAISNMWYKHLVYRNIVVVRGSLVSVIYSESLVQLHNVGDPQAAVTLMSTDVDRICQSLAFIQEIWSRALELGVGISLLALQIGWISVMPVAVVFISGLLDAWITTSIGAQAGAWAAAVQQRISLTAGVLSSLKSVRMLGIEKPMSRMIQDERHNELRFQAKFRWSTVWLNTIGNAPTALAAAITFTTYAIRARVDNAQSLDVSKAFTSLALISLVTTPANELLSAVPFTVSCFGSLNRIQEYLVGKRRQAGKGSITTADYYPQDQTRIPPAEKYQSKPIARLHNVYLMDSSDEKSNIKGIELELYPSSLTIITGPSGSGKSTFLRRFIGDSQYVRGTLSAFSSKVSYCPQSPWLVTATIRENICGLERAPVDTRWYTEVVNSCCLTPDFVEMPNGDLTVIDGQVARLSGGQRQRIALARALYHRPKLILLDDVLSALDADTEAKIMERLLGPRGLFQRLDAAVVLVTHAIKYESAADNIISINHCRNISVRTDLQAHTRSKTPGNDETCSHGEKYDLQTDEDGLPKNQAPDRPGTNATGEGNYRLERTQKKKLDGDLADYIYCFKSVRGVWVLIFFTFASINTVCYYTSQVVLQWWTADNGQHETKWMPLYACLACGNLLFFGLLCWAMFLRLVPQSASSLHQILLDSVMGAPYPFFASEDGQVGTILNRFSQDLTVVDTQLPTGLLCTVIYLFWTFGSLALISTGSRYMAVIIPVVFVVLYMLQKVYLRTSRRLRLLDLEMRSPLYSHFLDTLAGLSSIKAFGWEHRFSEEMFDRLDTSQVPYYLLICAQRWLNLVLDLIVAGLAIIVVTMAVKLKGASDPSSLGLSLNNILSFSEILSLLLQFWTQLEVSLGAITRTREFARITPGEKAPEPDEEGSRGRPSSAWPEHGAVEIQNLQAGFTSDKMILEGISLSTRPGEKIGVCGRTGSGKSSLLLAILGLLEPSTESSLLIDGVDLRSVSRGIIRERIITIPQDVFLFDGSVRQNLDPGAAYTDTQLIAVLSKVKLWHLIQTQGGLDSAMRSDTFSQGQKQLFGVARAILKTSTPAIPVNTAICGIPNESHAAAAGGKVVLLDEATSNVDRETDAFMQRIIREEFATHTIIVVAHRLDTVLDSDRIAVLDGGKLRELDTPQALLAKEDSAFAALYRVSRCHATAVESEGASSATHGISSL
ncbi:hypothetical protein PV08_05035 [Exophiala spinifera]|uniref:ABC transporter n=1 Tax=Exophiala spinifera TaxID=91928 RepID=A0A0D2BGT4_9EURO|nr:uncharacterized protein PV08_05035 [Exophiala spinifera]KIW17840.1 hypothetical protein PV08_05035 [Exophiala spinifera]